MEEKNVMDEEEELMLPGFRFHPTDEELVGFYLRRKIELRKPLSVELIRQLDIYKYDPWDLPKLAATGEKEWYFYCPRDRKYRNSSRPNRVTGAGFWKATGTDRPIYSSQRTKCIGLKKSLVFYKGRASKGIKTDWMMHEYRLPSPNILTDDSWAVCRIFIKTNATAKRADLARFAPANAINSSYFGSENNSCTINGLEKPRTLESCAPLEGYDFKSFNLISRKSETPSSYMFSTQETLIPFCASMDCGKQQPYSSYAVYYPLEVRENLGIGEEDNEEDLMVKKSVNNMIHGNSQWAKSDSFPFNFAVNTLR